MRFSRLFLYSLAIFFFILSIVLIYYSQNQDSRLFNLTQDFEITRMKNFDLVKELQEFKKRDEYKINLEFEEEIKNINSTYKIAISTYEDLLELKSKSKDVGKLDEQFAKILSLLSERNYASASSELTTLNENIKKENTKISESFKIPENVPVENTAPQSGFRRQKVQIDIGSYLVDVVSADLNSTKVLVDTASQSDCSNDCPTLPLAQYISRNGAFAGINGSYFCPAEYPSCTGKTNAFDTLLMNKDKVYFNSDNNVYSTVPAAIFMAGSARFVSQSLEWGRDTGVDAVIANHPLLVLNNQVVFGGNSDPKQGSRGARSFVGATGSTVYIGVVHNATVAEVARVLHAMGMQNALNLDSGGSTALWSGGYKVGPGRNIANALLFVRK